MSLPQNVTAELEAGVGAHAPSPVVPTRSHMTGSVRASRPTPHVMYVIDEICEMGGAELALLQMVRKLPPERFRVSVVTFRIDTHLEILQKPSFPLHVLPLRRTYDLGAAKSALRLRELIRRENVSIVHTFFESSDLWAGPVAKMSGCPILVSSRRDMGILRGRKHQLAYPFINPLFDRVLAVSDQVRSYCMEHDRIPAKNVQTVYNGIDIELLAAKAGESDARAALGLSEDVPVISTLANIRPVKGIDVLVRAAAQVCRKFPKAVFLVIGSALVPETYAQLQTLVRSLGLQDNVRFLGKQANPFPILRASDVFCLPSRNEGFSNALIEAMGCGLPCVATRVGGNAEALEEGTSGYMVESEDSDAMAERILRLLQDPESRARMGAAALRTVTDRFSVEAMMNSLMDVYEELLVAKHV